MEYGYWLELAYELFRLKKWKGKNSGTGSWQEWLTVNVGICPRYSQKLREVAKLLQNYSRFQKRWDIFFRNLSTKRTNYKFIAHEFYCCLLLAGCRPYKRLDWCIIVRLRRTTIWINSSLYIQQFYYTTRNLTIIRTTVIDSILQKYLQPASDRGAGNQRR